MHNNTTISPLIRKGLLSDKAQLTALFKRVAAIPGGLARTAEEITDSHMTRLLTNATDRGIIFVAEYNNSLIGCILCLTLEPKLFIHIRSETNILVDPQFQGLGIGSALIRTLQEDVMNHHPSIMMIELVARESNPAIRLYERMGFKKQGRLEHRVLGINGVYEADIPMSWLNPNFKKNN
ncbi:N-acetyltransferase [Candidatus Dependentiae bacterium Noda2021]|nr:N-acetyltransferase [Candidatus Dependentiae bacterium Noda2021]